MATSDKKMKDLAKNPEAYAVICKFYDNIPERDPKNWKMIQGMSVKQCFKFQSLEEFPQSVRDEFVAALDAIEL